MDAAWLTDPSVVIRDGQAWRIGPEFDTPLGWAVMPDASPTAVDGSWSVSRPYLWGHEQKPEKHLPFGEIPGFIESTGFQGQVLTGSVDQGFALTQEAQKYLIANDLDVRRRDVVDPRGDYVVQTYGPGGVPVGDAHFGKYVSDDAFGIALLAAAAFATAGAAGAFGTGGAAGGAGSAAGASGYDAIGSYLATGASDMSAASGFGGYAGAISGAPEVLTAAIPSSTTLWSASSVASSAVDSAPSSIAKQTIGPGSSSIGAGGASLGGSLLDTVGKTIGIIGSGAGLVSQLTGDVDGALGTPPAYYAQQQAAAASQRMTLLLIGGLVVAAVYLSRK